MKNITFTNEQIKKIYELSYSVSESRGKNRQNTINSVVIESLKSDPYYSGFEFKSEVRIPGEDLLWGKFFPVDVCIYKDGELIEIVLIKAPASNVQKNKINTLNSINGDITRLQKLDGIKVSIINFLPKETPLFKIDETIECFEKNLPFFLSKCGALYKFDIDEIYVLFQIDKLYECLTKKDVKNLFQKNPIKNIVIEQSIYKGLY
jgi:hypothetical protein